MQSAADAAAVPFFGMVTAFFLSVFLLRQNLLAFFPEVWYTVDKAFAFDEA